MSCAIFLGFPEMLHCEPKNTHNSFLSCRVHFLATTLKEPLLFLQLSLKMFQMCKLIDSILKKCLT